MILNKLRTGILLVSALIMTGCSGGGSSSAIAPSNPNIPDNNGTPVVNNELKYTVFDPFTDVINDKYIDAWGKLTYRLNNNGLLQTISTVVGSSPTAYQDSRGDNLDLEYYVSKNMFAAVPEKYDSKFYKINFINSDTFKLKLQSGNSIFNFTSNIITLDLTGLGKQPLDAKTGISTDLQYFPNSFNATFPSGSECYIILETPEQDLYSFDDGDDEGSITIDQWIANEKENNTVTNLIQENIGINNELPAARYTDKDGDVIAVVRYEGLIYDALYNQAGIQKFNTDPSIAKVYCDQFNDVAAKFFEEQIKANY